MDLEAISKHLGLDDSEVEETITETPEAPSSGKPAKVKEITVSYRITPKGSYSTVEFTQKVEVKTEDRKLIDGIKNQMRHEVLQDTIRSGQLMISEMAKKGLI